MKIETLLNLATTVFRQKFRENCPELSLPDLIPAAFDHLVQTFKVAFSSCGTEALKAYVESCDEKADTLTTPGGAVRFKMVCKKEFLTLNWKCFWKSARCSRLPARPSCMPMRASGQGWFRKWKERLLTERGAVEKVLRAMDTG